MKKRIVRFLQELELKYGVRVLFAAESGSHAWGFSSPDSDWDVRFIYVHPLRWYLTVEAGRDVIEELTDDGFDVVGWDIRKALQLYRKTNPSMLEWFGSPIIYKDDGMLREALQRLSPHFFNRTRSLYHYFHVASGHENRYLEKRGVELKRYLYFLRGLLACKWLMRMDTPPPVPFMELVDSEVSDPDVRREIEHVLDLKRTSREHDKEIVSDLLWSYGHQLLEEAQVFLGSFHPEKETHNRNDAELDRLLFDIITKDMFVNDLKTDDDTLSTKVTPVDLAYAVEDKYRVKYSKNGKRLIKCEWEMAEYVVKEGTEVICDSAFNELLYIKKIVLPRSLKVIGDDAFSDDCNLSMINFPKGLHKIGVGAFYGCTKLKSVRLPENLQTIGCRAFSMCWDKFASVKLPSKIKSIERGLFECCSKLSFVEFPESVVSIGDYVFYECEELEYVRVPYTLSHIGKDVFYDCENLKHIYISCPSDVDEITVIKKFKGMLDIELHDKMEIVKR